MITPFKKNGTASVASFGFTRTVTKSAAAKINERKEREHQKRDGPTTAAINIDDADNDADDNDDDDDDDSRVVFTVYYA